jgi:hypothetical protein
LKDAFSSSQVFFAPFIQGLQHPLNSCNGLVNQLAEPARKTPNEDILMQLCKLSGKAGTQVAAANSGSVRMV